MKKYIITLTIAFLCTCTALFADVDLTVGLLRLVIKDSSGSVFLYRKSNNGDYVPLFDSSRTSAITAYSLLLDKNVHKLDSTLGSKITSTSEGNNATINFTLKNKVTVSITYSLFAAVTGNSEDTVQVAIKYTNMDSVHHLIGIKAVFDTWLGEHSGNHFSTALRAKLDSEYYFIDMSKEKWIQSSNDDVSIRFLLDGDYITNSESVILANKNLLSDSIWLPSLTVGRRFDSFHAYNNSAMAITWKPVMVASGSSKDIYFYITTGAESDFLPDMRIIEDALAGDPLLEDSLIGVLFDDVEDIEGFNNLLKKYPTVPDPNIFTLENPADIAKIRTILARIRVLKADIENIDQEEILRLNDDIDVILGSIGGNK